MFLAQPVELLQNGRSWKILRLKHCLMTICWRTQTHTNVHNSVWSFFDISAVKALILQTYALINTSLLELSN